MTRANLNINIYMIANWHMFLYENKQYSDEDITFVILDVHVHATTTT